MRFLGGLLGLPAAMLGAMTQDQRTADIANFRHHLECSKTPEIFFACRESPYKTLALARHIVR